MMRRCCQWRCSYRYKHYHRHDHTPPPRPSMKKGSMTGDDNNSWNYSGSGGGGNSSYTASSFIHSFIHSLYVYIYIYIYLFWDRHLLETRRVMRSVGRASVGSSRERVDPYWSDQHTEPTTRNSDNRIDRTNDGRTRVCVCASRMIYRAIHPNIKMYGRETIINVMKRDAWMIKHDSSWQSIWESIPPVRYHYRYAACTITWKNLWIHIYIYISFYSIQHQWRPVQSGGS